MRPYPRIAPSFSTTAPEHRSTQRRVDPVRAAIERGLNQYTDPEQRAAFLAGIRFHSTYLTAGVRKTAHKLFRQNGDTNGTN